MKRALVLVLAAVALAGPLAVSRAAAADCTNRILVLSAFPGEIDHLINGAAITETVATGGREFFVGTLRGNDVILVLTGIGLVNAKQTTKIALDHFRCGDDELINRIVFSGVSGGASYIGDVTIPERWTLDDGKSWIGVDQSMFDIARRASESVHLASDVPLGDLACAGLDPDLIRTVHLDHAPAILVGGDGKSTDPFGGRRLPCVPGGGDTFGCRPCRAPGIAPGDPQRTITDGAPFLDPNFFFSYFASPPPPTSSYRAEDMETAAVARVAADHEIPFIAFRALSDGHGDPLMLPGFPFQFFFYRQIAADNASTMALAFLDAWAKR